MKRTIITTLTILVCLFLGKSLQARDSSSPPCGTKEVLNVVYKTVDKEQLQLNLYLPVRNGEQATNVPVLIWIDSGGYTSGNPGNGGYWRTIGCVEKGFAVASVSHRSLKAGNRFPTQIEDVKAAVRFLRAHSKEYGLDPKRFASMGASSGGHLSCMLGLSDAWRLFDVGENLDQSSQVQRVIDCCGATYIQLALTTHCPEVVGIISDVSNIHPVPGKALWEQPDVVAACAKYSTLTYVDKDYAPTFIIQGGKDTLILPSQSYLFYEMLNKVGVRTKIHVSEDAPHNALPAIPREILEKELLEFLQW